MTALGDFLPLDRVIAATGLSRTTIYEGVSKGTFPKPVPVGDRRVAWVEAEVEAWKRARLIAARGTDNLWQPPQAAE